MGGFSYHPVIYPPTFKMQLEKKTEETPTNGEFCLHCSGYDYECPNYYAREEMCECIWVRIMKREMTLIWQRERQISGEMKGGS